MKIFNEHLFALMAMFITLVVANFFLFGFTSELFPALVRSSLMALFIYFSIAYVRENGYKEYFQLYRLKGVHWSANMIYAYSILVVSLIISYFTREYYPPILTLFFVFVTLYAYLIVHFHKKGVKK